MSFDKFASCHCLCLIGTGDLKARTFQSVDTSIAALLVCLQLGMQISMKITLTSIEQPSSEPRRRAFCMIWNRFGGALSKVYNSAIPPVKSSKPSMVLPPERAS